MTLYEIVKGFENIALRMPLVMTAEDGSIYEIMNANPSIKYGVFVVTQNTHRSDEMFDYYGLTLFYCDRLDSDRENNRLQIQSFGKQVLENVIHLFCDEFDLDLPSITYNTWTQQFMDITAGCYAQFELECPKCAICPEEYES